jgi:hypothetical protein
MISPPAFLEEIGTLGKTLGLQLLSFKIKIEGRSKPRNFLQFYLAL